MSQNSIKSKVGSHICCENLSRNFKLAVFGRESHRRILSRLCASLILLPKQANPRHLSTSARHKQAHNKGLQRVQTLSIKRRLTERGALSYHPYSLSEIEVNTFDLQKDACSDPDQLCDSACGFHRNVHPALATLKHPEPHQQMASGEAEG